MIKNRFGINDLLFFIFVRESSQQHSIIIPLSHINLSICIRKCSDSSESNPFRTTLCLISMKEEENNLNLTFKALDLYLGSAIFFVLN